MSKKIVTYSDIVNSGGLPESLSSLRCVTVRGLDSFSNVVYKEQETKKTWQQLINEYEYEIQNWEYKLTVDPKTASITEGDTIDLSAEYTTKLNDSESSTEVVTENATWYSDNTSIVDMVDGRFGRVMGISQGTTTIWAEYEGKTDYCEITVKAAQEPDIPEPVITYELNISAESENIQLGSTTQLHATLTTYENGVSMSSEDVTNDVEWIASPENYSILNGLFNPYEVGTFTIYVALNDIDTVSNTISIDVTSPIIPESVTYKSVLIIYPESIDTYGEETVNFTATYVVDKYIDNEFAENIYNEIVTNDCQWSIDDPTVGTIDLNGVTTIYNTDGNATATAYFEGLEDYGSVHGSASITSHYEAPPTPEDPTPEVTVERIILTSTTNNGTPGNIVSTITGREGSTSSIYIWAYYSDGSTEEVSGDSNCICTIQDPSIAWYTTTNITHNNAGETEFNVSYTYNEETVTANAKIITLPTIPTDIEASLSNVYINEGKSAKVTLSGTLSNGMHISESGYFSIDKSNIDETRANITLRGNEIEIIGLERSNDAEDYIGYITAYFMYNNEYVSCNIDVYVYNEESLRYEIRITAVNDPDASQVEQINMFINDVKTLYAYFYIYDKDELIETPKYIGIDGTWTTSNSGIVSGLNGGEISNGGIYSHNIEGTSYISINYLYDGITYTSDTVSVHVRDENSYSYDLSVNPSSVELEFDVYPTWQVHCTATISVTAPNGSVTTTSKDVSEDVTIVSYDSRIINVSKGKDPEGDPYILLSAVNEGTTTVEFSYGESTKDIAYASLDVTVLPAPKYDVTLSVEPSISSNTLMYEGDEIEFKIYESAYKNGVMIDGYPLNVSNFANINIDSSVVEVLSQDNDKIHVKCVGSSNPTSDGDIVNITFSHDSGSYGDPDPVSVSFTVMTPFVSISDNEFTGLNHLSHTLNTTVSCLNNFNFTATILAQDSDWICFEDGSSIVTGQNGDEVRFIVAENTSPQIRSASITFESGGKYTSLNIIQAAVSKLLNITTNYSEIIVSSDAVGAEYPLTVIANYEANLSKDISDSSIIVSFDNSNVAEYRNGTITLLAPGHAIMTISYTENDITVYTTVNIEVGKIEYVIKASGFKENLKVGESMTISAARIYTIIDGEEQFGGIVITPNIIWVGDGKIGTVSDDNKTFTATSPGSGTLNLYIENHDTYGDVSNAYNFTVSL